jgi:predicted transcriptional regulator
MPPRLRGGPPMPRYVRDSAHPRSVRRPGAPRRRDRPLAPAQGCGYTTGMKTAVSLPDALFRAAEQHAQRAQKSRSQLYAEALAEYLARHAPDEVTEAMNRVADQLDPAPDAFAAGAARRVLERSEW